MAKPLALIMAGGTGGHIFPAQAVASALAADGWDIAWLGSTDRMEAKLVPGFGWPFYGINVAGLRGKGLASKLRAPWMIGKALWQAIRVCRQLKPTITLGFGGYASGPGGLASWLHGTPLFIHEQNAVAGSTNKLLARFARYILVAFDSAFKGNSKRKLVGNPIRAELLACRANRPASASLNILIVGGSLGAQALNNALPEQLAELAKTGAVAVRHQTGAAMLHQVDLAYQPLRASGSVAEVSAFIDDMAAAYRWADVLICRAGALTVSEVAAVGVAAIFVPLPGAIDDHQTANARVLADQNAAVLLSQQQLQQQGVQAILSPWLTDKTSLQQIAQRASALATTDAAARIAALCRQVTGQVV
ncbi:MULTISPECIES: undecaprenyldiphospho-muramoylpentapeptide beta-N-acetylglucosaminyltransferase [unclassified Arsukibacterium]|uniref:undecaprenyldiphospho-muramoylpentapeptide beta-N-acetylglucosaminyltransferase n=1 Tax=unclassified Arsukibacterium TaxID=2635278 RepID=UPI000C510DCA|nr:MULTISPECIES: undecaprenyldiphospho-muramoylpentapeptide beta-N-acetylglucosaminyltransferase [unclassified Arsukibacterium]MAA93907.1 undecaprenyldiphospho-muramoylpentapeptide beta-N-acetylglucosaminyltransferase [Rheinheimera sp.]MBM34931.1 undecaprenyldiphospho-muramoylpentapeptide beta-N-acetylglucosaminyltransferase [Rheinheimera sp.]|tara:strand:- start:43247 stop:44332 length:1086 start_codon:yes stop_codon:yes gene_type:complete